jgi:hypothetical protein
MEKYLSKNNKLEFCFILKESLELLQSLKLSQKSRQEVEGFIEKVERIINETIKEAS